MLESKFTGELLKALRATMPDAVVLKHTDLFTGGIPDFSVTRNRRTTWFEVKMNNNTPTELQTATLSKLVRAYVITYDVSKRYSELRWIDYQKKTRLLWGGTKQELVLQIAMLCEEE